MKKLASLLVLALLSVCFLSVANCAYGNTVNDDNTGSNGGSDNTGVLKLVLEMAETTHQIRFLKGL